MSERQDGSNVVLSRTEPDVSWLNELLMARLAFVSRAVRPFQFLGEIKSDAFLNFERKEQMPRGESLEENLAQQSPFPLPTQTMTVGQS